MSPASTSTAPLTFLWRERGAFLEGRLLSLEGIPSSDPLRSTQTVGALHVSRQRGFNVSLDATVPVDLSFAWPVLPLSAVGKWVRLGTRWARNKHTGRAFPQVAWKAVRS